MESLPFADLRQRAVDVLLNLKVVRSDGGPGLTPASGDVQYWNALWTHILEEIQLRLGHVPDELISEIGSEIVTPILSVNWSDRMLSKVQGIISTNQPYLAYFGRQQELEQLYMTGKFTMKRLVFRGVANYRLSMYQNIRSRLFVDFDADACILFHGTTELTSQLTSYAAMHYPGFARNFGRVDYQDTLSDIPRVSKPIFKRHFRHAYQQEYRMLWTHDEEDAPPFMNLVLGSLSDIGELVVLGG